MNQIKLTWTLGSILCACRVREAAARLDSSQLSSASDLMNDLIAALPVQADNWSSEHLIVLAWGIVAQHRHALEEQGVDEELRLSLEAAMRIDAPIDSVRTQALSELVPAVAPRAELVAIIGAALSAKPHDLLSCLGNTLSYSDAPWAWLSTSAVPQIEKIRSRHLFLVIHRDAWEHPLRVSIP